MPDETPVPTVHVLINPEGEWGDVPVISDGEACEDSEKMRLYWLQSEAGQQWMREGPARAAAAGNAAPAEPPAQSEADIVAAVLAQQAAPQVDPPAEPVTPPAETGTPDPTPGA